MGDDGRGGGDKEPSIELVTELLLITNSWFSLSMDCCWDEPRGDGGGGGGGITGDDVIGCTDGPKSSDHDFCRKDGLALDSADVEFL